MKRSFATETLDQTKGATRLVRVPAIAMQAAPRERSRRLCPALLGAAASFPLDPARSE